MSTHRLRINAAGRDFRGKTGLKFPNGQVELLGRRLFCHDEGELGLRSVVGGVFLWPVIEKRHLGKFSIVRK